MTTIGGEKCDTKGCTKNAGHFSEHRFPMAAVRPAGRTLAQALGNVQTCGVAKVVKGDLDAVTHRCRKPRGHNSNHHSGGYSWA